MLEKQVELTFKVCMFGHCFARLFDEIWKPQFDSKEWASALEFYLDLMSKAGPPGASSNGFNLESFNALADTRV